ncbi:MAG: LmeA family phospholipid-binding protein [Segniliparus sp.]|uniref:LmeA family phospholipid-binding protein n=1 Tax=Segniliparus sp. TaxID=2804064 RepID=UPI003F3D7149
MSDSNDSDPKDPAEGTQHEEAERPVAGSAEEPPTEKLPAADDATTVLPAVGEAADATAELPATRPSAPDETTELPMAEQEGVDSTQELPSPVPADSTTVLPSVETAELPAAAAAGAASADEPGEKPEPGEDGKAAGGRQPKRKLKTIALGLVVALLLGVVGVLGGELVARHLLGVCADEAAENILHTKVDVDYNHSKFLLSSLLDHEIPYLTVRAQNGSVDKFDQDGTVQLKEAIKGLNVSALLENVHVTKGGGSVGHMTTNVVWTEEGIRQTLANRDLKDPNQSESPITAVNAVKLDQEHNQFSIDVNGKIGVLQARAVIVIQPEIDKQHNLRIRVKSIDLPDFRKIGLDVSGVVNTLARPAIEQVAKRVASYPMGLKAKSVQVKPDSIVFQFYADNAPLVKGTKCSALRWFE